MTSTSDEERFGSLTAADVAALDAAAVELGVGVEHLMEVAALQVARLAWRMLDERAGNVRVMAGRGHNGGDGVAAARHLASWGCTVGVEVLSTRGRLDELMTRQARAASGAGVAVWCEGETPPPREPPALTIDAVLGIGMHGELRPEVAARLATMQRPILSIDVPSGMDATDGTVPDGTVRATATLTLGGCKRGMWTEGARRWTGDLYAVSIGLPPAAWQRAGVGEPAALRGGSLVAIPLPT